MKGRPVSVAPHLAFPAASAAPFTSLHLDPKGDVRVCCENRVHVVGSVREQSLLEIWDGEPLQRLRVAMGRDDLDLGCDGCAAGLERDDRLAVRAGLYDSLMLATSSPRAPVRLELELSNRCNLQCVMCNGELSSAIRTKRERRPPLPKVYDDCFFGQLAELAPGLQQVLFLGGEPFLGAESLRAFDTLIDHGFRGRCHVTTNGTIVNDRVRRILASLDVDVSVSVDGATRETVELIRAGVSYEALHTNIEWFADRLNGHGELAFHYCLMQQNWSELHRFLQWADDRDWDVVVIPVTHPMSYSLVQLSRDDLITVVSGMELTSDERGLLGRNRGVWDRQLNWVRSLLGDGSDATSSEVDVHLGGWTDVDRIADLARWSGGSEVHRLDLDPDGMVFETDPGLATLLGVEREHLVGSHGQALLGVLRARFGDLVRSECSETGGGVEDRVLGFAGSDGRRTVRVVLTSTGADDTDRWYLVVRRG